MNLLLMVVLLWLNVMNVDAGVSPFISTDWSSLLDSSVPSSDHSYGVVVPAHLISDAIIDVATAIRCVRHDVVFISVVRNEERALLIQPADNTSRVESRYASAKRRGRELRKRNGIGTH